MDAVIQSLVTCMPVFIVHFGTALIVLAIAVRIYIAITPHQEIKLIREGNTAAAVSLAGAIIGLALPLAFCLKGSVSLQDIVIWGSAILAIQLVTYFIVDRIIGNISENIAQQKMAPVIFLLSIKLAIAIINAAAIAS
jgi:putative membrane protein